MAGDLRVRDMTVMDSSLNVYRENHAIRLCVNPS